MEKIRIDLGERSYDIFIGRGLLDRVGEAVRPVVQGNTIALVTDDHVAPLYLKRVEESLRWVGMKTVSLVLPHGEETKCLASLEAVYNFLAENHITRADSLLALGGGVIGDLTGLAAATWQRGIAFVQVPTSLLAQVDSSVGGKTAVDIPQGKNQVGAIWQPAVVVIDPDTLSTLTDAFWRDGLGEVVKYGCMADEPLFAQLEALAPEGREGLMAHMDEIISRCVRSKAQVVAEDERDTGRRMILNFGHTIAHAIETCQHYTGLHHGEAVAAGMAVMTRLTEERGLTEEGTSTRLEKLLKALSLPTACPPLAEEEMIRVMASDKKAAGAVLNLIVLDQIGACRIVKESTAFFRGALQ